MAYIRAKDLKQFKWIPLKLVKIYPSYRSGWIKLADWSFIWRTFKYNI